jgi:hypothetical protein
MGRHKLKMWSFQTPDGRLAASVINQGTDAGDLVLGYVRMAGLLGSAGAITSAARYDANGVQSHAEIIITDDRDRIVRAVCPSMHSYIGWRVGPRGDFWGYEGVGVYGVDGWGRLPGAMSFFWPASIISGMLSDG